MDHWETVEDTARARGCRVIALTVPCNFCKRALTNIEKCFFDGYGMTLRWVGGNPYACCLPCLRLCARIEFALHLVRYTGAQALAREQGRDLCTLPVRCRSCLRPLSWSEKARLQEQDASLGIVRGRLRGICELCETVVV